MNLNLTNVNEVPANKLIETLALKLKEEEIVKPLNGRILLKQDRMQKDLRKIMIGGMKGVRRY